MPRRSKKEQLEIELLELEIKLKKKQLENEEAKFIPQLPRVEPYPWTSPYPYINPYSPQWIVDYPSMPTYTTTEITITT
jgi:hypothetical protein